MLRLINLCTVSALLAMMGSAPSSAVHGLPSVCGMGDKCAANCKQKRDPMVQVGPGNCINWFASAGCKQSR